MWSSENGVIRTVVIDSQSVYGHGLQAALPSCSPEIEVAAVATSPEQGTYEVKEHEPDVVVVGWKDDAETVNAIITMRELFPNIRLLMLTASLGERRVHEALRLGISGCLRKDAECQEIAAAIHVVRDGGVVISPIQAEVLLAPPSPRVPELVDCEQDVLKLVAQGLDNDGIAGQLNMSVGSVKRKVQSILAKLKVKNRAQAAAYAGKMDLV